MPPPPPPEIFEMCIANGAFWINLDHQLRAEILPIFSNIFHSSHATYFSHRECVGLFLHRRRDKGVLLKKGGSAPRLDPPLVDLPKQVLVLLCIYVAVMHFIQIQTFNKYCQLFPCIFPWNINITCMWTYTITEFMGISNFMLFVNKQTNIWCPLKCRSPVYICM